MPLSHILFFVPASLYVYHYAEPRHLYLNMLRLFTSSPVINEHNTKKYLRIYICVCVLIGAYKTGFMKIELTLYKENLFMIFLFLQLCAKIFSSPAIFYYCIRHPSVESSVLSTPFCNCIPSNLIFIVSIVSCTPQPQQYTWCSHPQSSKPLN